MAAVVLAGCATFGARPRLPRYQPTAGTAPPSVYTESEDPCVGALNATGMFRAVGTTVGTPTAFAELKRRQYLEPGVDGMLLSALSLFIVPARYQRDRTVLNVVMFDRQTGNRREFQVERETSTWGGALLFPVALFRWPAAETRRAEASLCKELAMRMRQVADGFSAP